MRISDWSSDVCSSDLAAFCICKSTSSADQSVPCVYNAEAVPAGPPRRRRLPRRLVMHPVHPQPMERPGTLRSWEGRMSASATAARKLRGIALKVAQACLRSEEHTSELQSLLRIPYAVFCLKQKI